MGKIKINIKEFVTGRSSRLARVEQLRLSAQSVATLDAARKPPDRLGFLDRLVAKVDR